MRRRSFVVPILALAALAPWPVWAGEAVPLADPLAQLAQIETEVKAVRQAGDTSRLAELREELRQLPVPDAAAVRASQVWAMTRVGGDSGGLSTDDPPETGSGGSGGKTATSAWDVEVLLEEPVQRDEGGGKWPIGAWGVEISLEAVGPDGQ